MKLKTHKGILLFFTLFVGIGALVGGICMLIKPDGTILHMENMLPYFEILPFSEVLFQDYIFSGIMLIIINGISNITATVLIFMNKKLGYVLGTIFGFTLMLWIIIQFVMFPMNALDIIYFTVGCLQLITGYMALVCFNQVNFKFNAHDYKNINKDSKTLVVYFSRMNYTKKIAYEAANNENAYIVGLKTKERTKGILGFWWCGRFGMHKWSMETLPLEVDINNYEKIILVTPIWVFKMCAPMRDFVIKNKDVLINKKVDVIFNHFNPWLPKGAIKEIEKQISINCLASKTTMLGHTFKK